MGRKRSDGSRYKRTIRSFASLGILTVLLSWAGACRSSASGYPFLALSGPLHFVPGFGLYTISGTVKNTGTAEARAVKVYVTIYPGALTAWTVTNPKDVPAGTSASFATAFSDPDQAIRNSINKDATRVDFRFAGWTPAAGLRR